MTVQRLNILELVEMGPSILFMAESTIICWIKNASTRDESIFVSAVETIVMVRDAFGFVPS